MVISNHFQWQNYSLLFVALLVTSTSPYHKTTSNKSKRRSINTVNAQTILLPQDLHWLAIEATRSVNPDVAKSYEDYHRKKQALKSSDLTKLKVVSKLGLVSDI